MLIALAQLAALGMLAAAAASAGWLLTMGLRLTAGVEALALRLAVGLGALGTVLFALGLVGALSRGPVLTAACGLPLLAAAAWRLQGRRAAGGGASPGEAPAPVGWWPWLVLAAVAPAFAWTLYPPIAFDATAYHLPFARAFAEAGRLVVVPELTFPVLPQLVETLFAGALLATGSDVAMHLVQFLAMVTTALLLVAAGQRFYSLRAGVLAAALWLAHPLVHYQGASGYVDVTLALFCLLAVVAWEVWHREGGIGWLALAGAAGGFAAASKHLGLLWLGLLAAMTLLAARRGRRLVGTGVLLLAALLVGGPWYLRLYVETGNPVFPMLGSMFGGPSTLSDRRIGIDEESPAASLGRALVRHPFELARHGEPLVFAWKASFDREAFNRQSPLAPWPLALAPLAALWAWRDRRLLRWLLLVLAYASLWTLADPRYQLPSVALLALVGAAGLEHLARRVPAFDRALARPALLGCLAVALLAPGPLYAGYKLWRLGPIPVTAAEREGFLLRQQPAYAAIRYLDQRFAGRYTVFTLEAPELAYHARGRLLGQWAGPFRFARLTAVAADPEAMYRELVAMRADALLVTEPELRRLLREDASYRRRFQHALGGDGFDLFLLAQRPASRPTAS